MRLLYSGTVRIKSGFAGGAGDTSDPLNHAGPNSGGAHRNPSQQRPHSMDAATLLAASSSEDASHDAHSAALYGDVGGLGGHAPSHLDLYHHPPSRPQLLNQDTTRHLMTSFLWVTKNTDQNILRSWWSESANRLDALIDVLELCVSNFEYKGRKMMKRQSTLATKRVFDMRRKLELSIAGTGSARMEFLKRRAAGVDRSPGSGSGSNNTANATSGEAGTRFDKETWFQVIPNHTFHLVMNRSQPIRQSQSITLSHSIIPNPISTVDDGRSKRREESRRFRQ